MHTRLLELNRLCICVKAGTQHPPDLATHCGAGVVLSGWCQGLCFTVTLSRGVPLQPCALLLFIIMWITLVMAPPALSLAAYLQAPLPGWTFDNDVLVHLHACMCLSNCVRPAFCTCGCNAHFLTFQQQGRARIVRLCKVGLAHAGVAMA